MTDDDYSPLTNAFELQRTTIEQSREAFERIVEFQLQMSEAAISGTEVTSELYRQGIEMNRRALHNYLDAVEATLPRSNDAVTRIRDTIDEQFDQLEAQQEEALSMAEETVGDAEQSSDAYLEALDDQLDILVNAHKRTEQRTVEALEQIETQVEQLQEEGQEQADELQERVQDLQDQLQPTVSED
jgi:hypothetical protein